MTSADQTIRVNAIQDRTDFAPGTTLGSYRILRKIGAGGMGAVYEVVHTMLHQRFALKTLFVQGESAVERQDCINRFLQEARITSQLSHPGIVAVQTLEQDQATGALYFVMDYVSMTKRRRNALLHSAFASDMSAWRLPAPVEAESDRISLSLEDLYQYGKRIGRRMNPEIVRQVAQDVASALDYAHHLGSGIIHRDIKPANILIREDGHAVLADFGVAKIADAVLRRNVLRNQNCSLSLRMEAGGESYHLVLGTVEYMAPELRSGSPPSPQTDLYALGATIYQLLMGELPSAETLAPSSIGLNPLWDDILQRCLVSDPAQRYPRLQALEQDLMNFSKTIRMRKIKRWGGIGAGVAAVAAVLGVAGSLYFARSSGPRMPEEGLWVSRPTSRVTLEFQPTAAGLSVRSVHPDTCGTLTIPAHYRGRPVTAIAPDAFKGCAQIACVYVPETLQVSAEQLTPVVRPFSCLNPECDACKTAQTFLDEEPPLMRAYTLLPQALVSGRTTLVAKTRDVSSSEARSSSVNVSETVRTGREAQLAIGSTYQDDHFAYTLDAEGWVVERMVGEAQAHVDLPDAIKGRDVYKLGDSLFAKNKTIRSIRFPERLQVIGEKAFIESGLEGRVIFPPTLHTIKQLAFVASNIDDVLLPDGLTTIETSAFQNCRKLKQIDLPESLTKMGSKFITGTSMEHTTFRVPSKVTSLECGVFWHIGKKIQNYEMPSITRVEQTAMLIEGSQQETLYFNFGAKDVTFDSIAVCGVAEHPKLMLFSFPPGARVKFHPRWTDKPEKLVNRVYVRVGNDLSVWNGKNFVGTAKLDYPNAICSGPRPDGFLEVNDLLLFPTEDLKGWKVLRNLDSTRIEVVIPKEVNGRPVTHIGAAVFQNNLSILKVTLPDTIKVIGADAFRQAENLSSLNWPKQLEILEAHALQNCYGLKDLTLSEGLKELQHMAICGIPFNQEVLEIPASVTRLYDNSLMGLGSNIKKIRIPSVEDVTWGTLNIASTGKKSIVLEFGADTVTLRRNSLYVDKNYHEAVIFQFKPNAKVTFEESFINFLGGEEIMPIENAANRWIVRIGDRETMWNGREFIGDAVFTYGDRKVGGKQTVTLDQTSTALESRGADVKMSDEGGVHNGFFFRPFQYGWEAAFVAEAQGADVVFPDTINGKPVLKIGDELFRDNKTIRSVVLPAHLREIGKDAFSNCGLTGPLHLPETVEVIRETAFANTRKITTVKFPPNLRVLETSAFQNVSDLEQAILPDTITTFGAKVFCGTQLKQDRFRYPPKVTQLTCPAFWYMGGNLEVIELPTIGFYGSHQILLTGTGKPALTLQFGARAVYLAKNAIFMDVNQQRSMTLQFREDAKIVLHPNFILGRNTPLDKFSERNISLVIRQGKKQSTWNGTEFVGDAEITFTKQAYNEVTWNKETASLREEVVETYEEGKFTLRKVENQISVVKCNQAKGVVNLPACKGGEILIIEKGAFSGCMLTGLAVPQGKVVFKDGAFAGAAIKTIRFQRYAPLITRNTFKGLKGRMPNCQVVSDGETFSALVIYRSLTFLRRELNPEKLYLFDFGASPLRTVTIPESVVIQRKRYAIELLPGCFSECEHLTSLTVLTPYWTDPNVFKQVPTLKKLTLPRSLERFIPNLRRELRETDIEIFIR